MENALKLAESLTNLLADSLLQCRLDRREVTVEVASDAALTVFTDLRDRPEFAFEQLIDLCGVDYAAYGKDEWATIETTGSGFSRGVEPGAPGRDPESVTRFGRTVPGGARFAVVYHLLSQSLNHRVRVRVFAPDDELPVVDSVCRVWASADWFEREAFDLLRHLFEGHSDLRRTLTDYGFVGHPFRKDFPLSGHVEMRYDPERGRVVYEPVSIEPRVLVPRVVRADHRYQAERREENSSDA